MSWRKEDRRLKSAEVLAWMESHGVLVIESWWA